MNKDFLIKLFCQFNNIMTENRNYLIELDSVVGDGDLGLTMSEGFNSAYKSVKETTETDIGKILYFAGKTMSNAVPSTMGTLMASGFMQAGKNLKGLEKLENSDIVNIFSSYLFGVANRGKAKIGEKTFLDALSPAVVAMQKSLENGENLKAIANTGKIASEQGFKNTTNMVAVHGRAAIHGEKSKKLKDPGAAVAMLMMQAFDNCVTKHF